MECANGMWMNCIKMNIPMYILRVGVYICMKKFALALSLSFGLAKHINLIKSIQVYKACFAQSLR